MEFIMNGEQEAERWYSPVKIERVTPKGSGAGEFDLEFYHAAYPAGVRNKVYPLRTLSRTRTFILAAHLDEPDRQMTVLLHALAPEWLKMHFNIEVADAGRAQLEMERIMRSSY
jgi:hypothetical protein